MEQRSVDAVLSQNASQGLGVPGPSGLCNVGALQGRSCFWCVWLQQALSFHRTHSAVSLQAYDLLLD